MIAPLKRLFSTLWGNFQSPEELKKFFSLAILFGTLIGIYWTLRPIKDSIFASMVGVDYQPWAKITSMFLIAGLVIAYSKLVDTFPRQKVFYGLSITYACLALLFSILLANETFGIPNTVESPTRLLGWAWYFFVESFGSLIISLFWALTTDMTSPDAAKRGFPIIALFGQVGNAFVPLVLGRVSKAYFNNSAPIVGILGGLMLVAGIMLWRFMRTTPKKLLEGYKAEAEKSEPEEKIKEKAGFLQGLKLLLTKPYLLGIFAIISVFEIVATILDFHMKTAAKLNFPAEIDMANFLNKYAVYTGIVSMLCVIFGINNIQRKLGMGVSLMALPILMGIAVLTLKFTAVAGTPNIEVIFWIMVFAKAVNYALNQPTVKQLYIPTSRKAKYQSQAWIEMFGSRTSKGIGSGINTFKKVFGKKFGAAGFGYFVNMSTLVSLALIGGWLFVAMFVGTVYKRAIQEKRVVC